MLAHGPARGLRQGADQAGDNLSAIAFDGVGRTFDGGRRLAPTTALAGLSFTVSAHETVAIVGPSGCGKTTLLELLCGLQQPDAGTITAPPAALMPQRDLLLPWLTTLDNAALPLRLRGQTRAAASAAARDWCARLGLDGFEGAAPRELSGGMRQRVSFARAMLAGTPALALDEPFASLDAITRGNAQAWLADALASEPRTVMLVTHDVEEAVLLADRVLVMSPRPGRIVADLPVPLPRPRHRADPAVVALRTRALAHLGALE